MTPLECLEPFSGNHGALHTTTDCLAEHSSRNKLQLDILRFLDITLAARVLTALFRHRPFFVKTDELLFHRRDFGYFY